MYQFTPEDINQKLLDLQAAFEKCMSQPKPDMVLANHLKRDIAFYTALKKEYSSPSTEGGALEDPTEFWNSPNTKDHD
jgi:hypothetical protein